MQEVPFAEVQYPQNVIGFKDFWDTGPPYNRWCGRGSWPPEPPPGCLPAGAENAWAVFDHMGLGWPPVAGYAVGDYELWIFVYETIG